MYMSKVNRLGLTPYTYSAYFEATGHFLRVQSQPGGSHICRVSLGCGSGSVISLGEGHARKTASTVVQEMRGQNAVDGWLMTHRDYRTGTRSLTSHMHTHSHTHAHPYAPTHI